MPYFEPPMLILSDTPPMGEAGTPNAGTATKATRQDHQHPRLTATATGTLNASAQADIVFTRSFTSKPAVTVLAVENNTNPVPRFKVQSWVIDGQGKYTGCKIYGDKARALPALSGILLVGPLITALAGFLPYEPAVGAEYSLIALQPSSV